MTARLVAAVIAGYGVLLLWAWALCRAAARCPYPGRFYCSWCGEHHPAAIDRCPELGATTTRILHDRNGR